MEQTKDCVPVSVHVPTQKSAPLSAPLASATAGTEASSVASTGGPSRSGAAGARSVYGAIHTACGRAILG